jgi:hypothetical protein
MAKADYTAVRPVTLEARTATGVLHLVTLFRCTCDDQNWRDGQDGPRFCKHIQQVLANNLHLIAINTLTFTIPSMSADRRGISYKVTIASCDCGGTYVDRTGKITLCEGAVLAYQLGSGWRAPAQLSA